MTTNAIPSGFTPTVGQQQTLTLIQPIQHGSTTGAQQLNQLVHPNSNMTINNATHIQPTMIQQNQNLGNVVPTQVLLTNNGQTSTNPQPTQYVVQNVATPVSFVQSKLKSQL